MTGFVGGLITKLCAYGERLKSIVRLAGIIRLITAIVSSTDSDAEQMLKTLEILLTLLEILLTLLKLCRNRNMLL